MLKDALIVCKRLDIPVFISMVANAKTSTSKQLITGLPTDALPTVSVDPQL